MRRRRKGLKQLIRNEGHVKEILKDWFDDRAAWSYAPVQGALGEHGIHDRVGCVPIVITPDMVGRRVGVFVSIEAKGPGRRGENLRGMTSAQFNHMRAILAAGGASTCCDGYEDLKQLEEWFPWLTKPTSQAN